MENNLLEQIVKVAKSSSHSANAKFELLDNGDIQISVANNGQSAELEVQNLSDLRAHIEENANINGLYGSFIYADDDIFYFFMTK